MVGIDEAGYGPVLGPLVVSAAMFEVEPSSAPRDFWDALRDVPVKRPSEPWKAGETGLVIGDSKKVYAPSRGLGQLEAGVLTFACAAGLPCPTTLAAFLGRFASLGYRPPAGAPWYEGGDRALPMKSPDLPCRAILKDALERCGLKFHGFLVRPVFEADFNERVSALGNKARFLFEVAASLSGELAERFPEPAQCHFYYDKQGARNFYGPLLLEKFPSHGFLVETEGPAVSSYRLTSGGRCFLHRFEVKGDDRHFPVGLAAMCSKYVRELFLDKFNAFWRGHLPQLRPTAGYFVDAHRFLRDTAPLRRSLGIDDALLIRSR